MARPKPTRGLTEEQVLGRLREDPGPLAQRALRRREAWLAARQAGASAQSLRSLRRAWERGRDEALAACETAGPASR